MTLLTEKQKDSLEERIRTIESRTDAEIVMVLATRSDNYGYAPALFAACTSMLIPLASLFWPFWLSLSEVVFIQFMAFFGLTILLRIPALVRLVVPRRTKFLRASNIAMRQFLTQQVHTTKDNLGLLIFVSELEHYIEIIPDHGLRRIENTVWEMAISNAIPLLQRGRVEESFKSIIDLIGSELVEHFPKTRDKAELPNRLIEI
mgnify:FL=1